MTKPTQFEWENIHEVRNVPGIYAWYFRLKITTFDINQAIQAISDFKNKGDIFQAEVAAKEFLLDRIFRYFAFDPYTVQITGQLMPAFSGNVENEQIVSDGLVQKIVADPKRLFLIQGQLLEAAPMFSSPLYIGKSDKLRTRLVKHKSLIEQYRKMQPSAIKDKATEDTNFALRVAARRMPPGSLFVVAYETAVDGDSHVDLENIFNRICYPVLGRN